jgi:hypothetical protein
LHYSITQTFCSHSVLLLRLSQAQRGQGKSNFVFTSEISMGSVMAEADNLKKKLKTSEMEKEVSIRSTDLSVVSDTSD